MSESHAIAANWYPDPSDARWVRWWDGVQWTEHVQQNPAWQPPPPSADIAPGAGSAPTGGYTPSPAWAPVASTTDGSALPAGTPPYKETRTAAMVVMVMLGMLGALDLLQAVTSGGTQLILTMLWVLIWLFGSAPTFVFWFHRMYSNLGSLGATGMRFGRGWAIGAWFVPILNLVRPAQMAADAWRASDPDSPAQQGDSWRSSPADQIVMLWWSLLLLSGFVARASETSPTMMLVSSVVGAASSGAAIAYVWKMDERQRARASRLGR